MAERAPAPITADNAIANAARLLYEAETHLTNLPMMERLDSLADTWLGVAALLTERERV